MLTAFTLSEKEFVRTSVRFARRSPWLFAIRILLIAAIAGAGVLLIAAGNAVMGIAILVFALLLPVLRPIAARLATARTFSASKFMHCQITAEIDDEGTRFTYSSGTSDTKWNGYTDWGETGDMFVLFLSDRFVRILPKRAFSESDLTSLRALLERKLPKR
jgi:YcxB-like protein